MAVAFRILGGLEVARIGDDTRLAVPAGHARQLLGVLLLHEGRIVGVDTLAEVLWDDDPPPSHRKLIQARISQLRRLLGSFVAVDGSRAGYRLTLRAGTLDLREHQALVAETSAGAPADREALLDRALSLWRGPALAELGGTARGARIVADLTEEYLATVEAHADAALASGRCPALATRLARVLAEHPLRERVRAQLMRALHRAGRQADALSVFDQGRRLLAEELGVDPGQELRAAHAEILAGDGPVTPTGFAEQVPVPRQLPPAPGVFVGREHECAELVAAAAATTAPGATRAAVVAVHGPGGQGKSTVVIEVAHRLAESFPDGQLYVDLLGSTPGATPLTPGQGLRRLLRALGVAPHSVPDDAADAASLYRSTLAGRRVLVVLDNAVGGAQVVPLLPGAPGCAALITSRRTLGTVDAVQVALDPLSTQDSVRLLARHSGREPAGTDHEFAERIAEICGQLPLALRIAAARLHGRPDWSLADLHRRLHDERRRLDELNFDHLEVRSSLALSCQDLDASTARAFRLLGLLPLPSIGVPAAAALLDVTESDADLALDQLVRARLVEVGAAGRFRLHDLVRLFAVEQAERHEPATERSAAAGRVLEYFQLHLENMHTRLRPHNSAAGRSPRDGELPEVGDAARWISDESENLVAAARIAAESAELAPRALTIAKLLPLYLWALEMRGEIAEIGQVAARAANRIGTDSALVSALDARAVAAQRLGRLTEAHTLFTAQLDICRRQGDREGEGRALGNIGIVLRELNRLDEALASLTAAGEIFTRYGPAGARPMLHACLSDVHIQAGRFETALAEGRAGLELSDDDPTCAAYALVSIGQAHCLLGDQDAALTALDECVTLCRRLNLHNDEWEALLCRSEVHLLRADPDAAIADSHRALELLGRQGDRYGRGAAYRQLAKAFTQLSKPDAAAYAEQADALLPGPHPNPLLESVLDPRPTPCPPHTGQ